MKKLIQIVLIVLSLSLIFSALVACDTETLAERTEKEIEGMTDREKSDYFSDKSNEFYKNGMITTQSIEGTMSGKMMGVKMTSRLEGTETKTEKNFGADDMTYISVSEFKTTTEVMNEKQVESYTQTEAFCDGYMYYSKVLNDDNDNTNYLKSACTAEEFCDYRNAVSERDPDIDITNDCKNVTVTKSEDGKLWVLTFSDPEYDETSSIQKFAKAFASLPVELLVEEFNATLNVDVETNALISSEMNIVFIADESDCEITLDIKATATYALPAEDATFLPENHSDYVETDSIIYAYHAINAIENLVSSDNASMELNALTKIDVIQGGQTITASSYEETDDIHYLKDNDVFKYYITADTKTESGAQAVTQKMIIDFDGSKQKIYLNDTLYSSTDQGHATAKNFIFTTLKAFRQSLDSATSISVNKADNESVLVTIELLVDPEIIEAYADAGFDTSSLDISKHILEITLDKNNSVTAADYSLELDGYLNAEGTKIKSKLFQSASLTQIGAADSSLFAD